MRVRYEIDLLPHDLTGFDSTVAWNISSADWIEFRLIFWSSALVTFRKSFQLKWVCSTAIWFCNVTTARLEGNHFNYYPSGCVLMRSHKQVYQKNAFLRDQAAVLISIAGFHASCPAIAIHADFCLFSYKCLHPNGPSHSNFVAWNQVLNISKQSKTPTGWLEADGDRFICNNL